MNTNNNNDERSSEKLLVAAWACVHTAQLAISLVILPKQSDTTLFMQSPTIQETKSSSLRKPSRAKSMANYDKFVVNFTARGRPP